MLSFNLHAIIKARGINRPFSFLVKAGLRPHTASNLLNNNISNIKIEHIEQLCIALVCDPQDLFVWHPNKGVNLPQDHPLQKIRASETLNNWHATLESLPYKQLKEMAENITAGKKTSG